MAPVSRRRKSTARYVGGFTAISNEHMRIRHDDRGAFLALVELSARAAWERRGAVTKRGRVRLDRGQCVFGLRELAECLGLPVSTLRRKLDKLVQVGAVNIATSRIGSVATIPFLARIPATTGSSASTQTDHSAAHLAAAAHARNGDSTRSAKSTGSLNGTQADRPRHLTQSAATDGVGTARHNSSNRKESQKQSDRRPVKLHAYQEKWRRRVLREAYRRIPFRVVSALIAARLAEHSIPDCMAVVRADASEVISGGKASNFGLNTWSAKNFSIKLQDQLRVEQERRERREPVPWSQSRALQQRRLDGEVRLGDGATERDVLLAKYDEFTWRFHKHKGTWPDIKHLRDREDHMWFRHDEVGHG